MAPNIRERCEIDLSPGMTAFPDRAVAADEISGRADELKELDMGIGKLLKRADSALYHRALAGESLATSAKPLVFTFDKLG
jgi:hypothetical protein